MILRYIMITFVLTLGTINLTVAQNVKFDEQMAVFAHQDSITPPKKDIILFIGSSSFTKWDNLASYFPKYKVLNRGFGGSTIPEVINYAEQVLFAYQPKQIIIYCGDNDIANKLVLPEDVLENFKTLYKLIRSRLGRKVNVSYISIKPSPKRAHNLERIVETNRLINAFLDKEKNTAYIDIYYKMLTLEGKPDKELFLSDNLHMNSKGYELWTRVISPYLINQ